jgi:sugar lactone lactonase YvrE
VKFWFLGPDDFNWNSRGITVAGTSSNQLNGPRGLFFDQKTQISYISDRDNNRILEVLPNGHIRTIAGDPNGNSGTGNDRLDGPSAIYVDENRNLFISDTNNHRVQMWKIGSSSGTTVAGQTANPGSALDQLHSPQAIWVDSKNNLYIADLLNHRIVKWQSQSSVVVAGGNGAGNSPNQLNDPVGLYFDEPNNDLYISNYLGHSIMKWKIGETQGTFIAGIVGQNGPSSTQLNHPSTVELDKNGNIYIADTYNHRIQLFCNDSSKEGKTIAGITGQSGNDSNQFNFPHDLALDTENLHLYVADSDNNRVQKFSFISPPSSMGIRTTMGQKLIFMLITISIIFQ